MTLDDDLCGRVRELRAAGRFPKQITRALGVRPAIVAPLVRTIAQQEAAAEPQPAVVVCWISPGWSTGLNIDGHDDWSDVATPIEALTGSPVSSWLDGIVRSECPSAATWSMCTALV